MADRQTEGEVGAGLVLIVAALGRSGVPLSGGLLGGEFGYGAIYENSVFEMHPFCWCDRDDCAWCANCSCPESAWHHFVDGREVSAEKFDEFFTNEVGEYPTGSSPEESMAWEVRANKANERRHTTKEALCHWCVHPELVRANFFHRASGTKITWYKYIGRGMEIELKGNWAEIVAECVASIGAAELAGASPAIEA